MGELDETARARIERLVKWVKLHRKDLCDADGEPSSTKLAAESHRRPSYWSDVLRLRKPSFGARAARDAEDAFGIPPLHLDGAGWPFEEVDQARFDRLSQRQKGRIEQALMDALDRIEAETSQKRDAGT